MKLTKKYYYVNIWTGELLTLRQMLSQAENEYDFDDFTNAIELTEYYELTDIAVIY